MNDSPQADNPAKRKEKEGFSGIPCSANNMLSAGSLGVFRTSIPSIVRPSTSLPVNSTYDPGDKLYRSHTVSTREIETRRVVNTTDRHNDPSPKPTKPGFLVNLSTRLAAKQELKPLTSAERRKVKREREFADHKIVEIDLP